MILRPLCLISCLILLVSCNGFSRPSFIQKRDVEYLNAKTIPPLSIPEGIDSHRIHNDYPVPAVSNVHPGPINIAPPGLED